MKKIIFGAIFLMSTSSFAQLKIYSNGDARIGTGIGNPWAKLHVNGTVVVHDGGHTLRILASNPEPEIGSSSGNLTFWHSTGSWTDLHAGSYATYSDSLAKHNILELNNNLSLVNKITPYQYTFKRDSTNKLQYGFMAQEIERVIPSAVTMAKDKKLVNYQMIIPVLIGGMQEQQKLIERQDSLISLLTNKLNDINENLKEISTESVLSKKSENREKKTILYQNKPNPFSNSTVIKYELADNSLPAELLILDLSGKLIKTYKINDTIGEISIAGNQFPAGMYIYALVVNGVEVDSKKMILTE